MSKKQLKELKETLFETYKFHARFYIKLIRNGKEASRFRWYMSGIRTAWNYLKSIGV